MATLYVTIGAPGAGKSYWANKKAKECGAVVVSSDEIRKEFYGDESIQGDGAAVFREVHRRIRKNLAAGKDVIFDATNKRYRRDIFTRYQGHKIIAVRFKTSLKECKRRNSKRERKVKKRIIKDMYYGIKEPTKKEGFADIIYV